MKRCLFSFAVLVLLLSNILIGGGSAHAAATIIGHDKILVSQIARVHYEGTRITSLLFTEVGGDANAVAIRIPVSVFKTGYLAVNSAAEALPVSPGTVSCSREVAVDQMGTLLSHASTLKLTFVEVSERPSRLMGSILTFTIRADYEFLKTESGPLSDMQLIPSDAQFASCMPTLIRDGVEPVGPGLRLEPREPLTPPCALGSCTDDDADPDPLPPTLGEPPAAPSVPSEGEAVAPGELPNQPQSPVGLGPVGAANPGTDQIANSFQGSGSGCSLNAVVTRADGSYALWVLVAALPLLSRKKR